MSRSAATPRDSKENYLAFYNYLTFHKQIMLYRIIIPVSHNKRMNKYIDK